MGSPGLVYSAHTSFSIRIQGATSGALALPQCTRQEQSPAAVLARRLSTDRHIYRELSLHPSNETELTILALTGGRICRRRPHHRLGPVPDGAPSGPSSPATSSAVAGSSHPSLRVCAKSSGLGGASSACRSGPSVRDLRFRARVSPRFGRATGLRVRYTLDLELASY